MKEHYKLKINWYWFTAGVVYFILLALSIKLCPSCFILDLNKVQYDKDFNPSYLTINESGVYVEEVPPSYYLYKFLTSNWFKYGVGGILALWIGCRIYQERKFLKWLGKKLEKGINE